jgi:hypothetical protein
VNWFGKPKYKETRPFIDHVGQSAYATLGLPLVSLCGAGQPVRGSLAALIPAGIKATQDQVIVSVYGDGQQPSSNIVQQPLTRNPFNTGGSM